MQEMFDQEGRSSLLKDMLRSLTRAVCRRPLLTLWFVAFSASVSSAVTLALIDFKTDRSDLIDPEAAFQKRWVSYTEDFGDGSDIVVAVQADQPEAIKEVLDDLGERMQREPAFFSNVFYKIEPGRLRDKGLQYLSPAQLEAGLEELARYRPILDGDWVRTRVDLYFDQLREELQEHVDGFAATDRTIRNPQSTIRNRRPADPSALRSPQPSAPDPRLPTLLRRADRVTASLEQFLADDEQFQLPWPEVVEVDPKMREQENQVVYPTINDEGTLGFLKAFPATRSTGFDGETRTIERLRELVAEVKFDHPEVEIGITGLPVLENDEMRRSQDDMLKASLISFLGVGLLLFLGFRGFRHPLLALVMLAVGMAWAFGYTTLAVGHLNILSVSFAVILIGLGIDFAIHYLARYLQLRHEGHLLRPALLRTSASVGAGIVTAAVTTALAFFCAMFTQFVGVAELGIIAGGGVLLCAAATFLALPPLIAVADRRVEPRRLPTPFEGTALRLATQRFPLAVLLVSAAAIVGIGMQVADFSGGAVKSRVGYDSNLLNLQAAGLESVDLQTRIFRESKRSLLFAVSVAESPEEARRLRAEFERLPTVHHVEDLASRLPAHDEDETRLMVQAFRAELADLPESRRVVFLPALRITSPERVGQAIENFYMLLRDNLDRIGTDPARRLAGRLDRFLDRFEEQLPSFGDQVGFLNKFQIRMTASLLAQFEAINAAADPEPIGLGDLPPELTSRFVSEQGKWLLQVYPKDQVWDGEPLRSFVADVRSVDPEVTGTPLQNYEASSQIRESYQKAAVYAFAVICVVLLIDFLDSRCKLVALVSPLWVMALAATVLQTQGKPLDPVLLSSVYVGMALAMAAILDFRNLRDAALAMLPPLAGGVLMFGSLALMGQSLNPANLIVLPLILGIGVDNGVHVVHDFRSQRGRYRTSPSTMNAIVLTSLTSMVGFGSMMVAAHRGLYSVGLVLVIGVASCLFVSLVPLPAVLTLLSPRRPRYARTIDEEADGPKRPQPAKAEPVPVG